MRVSVLGIATFLGWAIAGWSGELPLSPKDAVPSQHQIQKWVEDLGSNNFEVREMASRNLTRAGTPALGLVLPATKSEDPEVVRRATLILAACRLRAFEALESAGASINRHNNRVSVVQFDENSRRFAKIKKISVTDAILENLLAFPELENLILDGTPISDHALIHIGKLSGLRFLSLGRTKICDDGLKKLGGLTKLTYLNLDHTKIDVSGLKDLGDLTNLRGLDLTGTLLTDSSLEIAVQGLKKIKKLQSVSLDSTNLTDAGLRHVRKIESLERLLLGNTKIIGTGLIHLKGLARLHTLDLDSTAVTDKHLVVFKEMNALTDLNLRSTKVTDTGLSNLYVMKKIERIDLSYTKVTVAGIKGFRAISHGCGILYLGHELTEKEARELENLQPDIEVRWIRTPDELIPQRAK